MSDIRLPIVSVISNTRGGESVVGLELPVKGKVVMYLGGAAVGRVTGTGHHQGETGRSSEGDLSLSTCHVTPMYQLALYLLSTITTAHYIYTWRQG